jgi:predicted nicotinamide N-methyase
MAATNASLDPAEDQAEEVVDIAGLPGQPLRLLQVQDLWSRVDRDALLRDDTVPEPPYWAHLWPGGRALARLVVASAAEFRGRWVMELGCGLGLPGLAAARCGARVVLSDRNLETLGYARRNLRRNRLAGHVVAMDWDLSAVRGRFSFLLAADVTYDPESHASLLDFARGHLAPTGELWIVESVRAEEGALPARMAGFFEVTETRLPETEEGRRVWVRVLRGKRRG